MWQVVVESHMCGNDFISGKRKKLCRLMRKHLAWSIWRNFVRNSIMSAWEGLCIIEKTSENQLRQLAQEWWPRNLHKNDDPRRGNHEENMPTRTCACA